YRFLSNFYPATVVYEGLTYPDSEHAYQSAKTLDMNERRRIAALPTPAEAKRAGEALTYRPAKRWKRTGPGGSGASPPPAEPKRAGGALPSGRDGQVVKYRVMLFCV